MGELTDELLPLGLMLQSHIEMESITIGGLAMGFGIETNSHKVGLFQESVLEYEFVDSHGRRHSVTKDQPELFYALPWSYGTVGFLTSLKARRGRAGRARARRAREKGGEARRGEGREASGGGCVGVWVCGGGWGGEGRDSGARDGVPTRMAATAVESGCGSGCAPPPRRRLPSPPPPQVKLLRTQPYVRVEYLPTSSAAELTSQLQRLAALGEGQAPDFLEATLYDRDNAVIQARRAESQPRASREPAQMLRS